MVNARDGWVVAWCLGDHWALCCWALWLGDGWVVESWLDDSRIMKLNHGVGYGWVWLGALWLNDGWVVGWKFSDGIE